LDPTATLGLYAKAMVGADADRERLRWLVGLGADRFVGADQSGVLAATHVDWAS
jgi:hypothetical protein